MAGGNLHGLNVARLAIDGFEQVELTQPRQALEGAKPNNSTHWCCRAASGGASFATPPGRIRNTGT
jgi:hypothetical protein